MMTLKQVARMFDDQTFTDTFGSDTFAGQLLPFSDSVRSGSSTRRRILDVGPAVSLPTEKTVTEGGGQVYIAAAGNEDYYKGEVIRVKYPVVPVDNTYAVRTIGELLAASGGLTGVYASISNVRNIRASEEQSAHEGGFIGYFSPYYSVEEGDIIVGSSLYYRAKGVSVIDDVGFSVVELVEVSSPLSSVTVQRKGTTMDPATDDYAAVTPITGVSVFTERIALDYQHEALGFVELEPGDKSISFLKSVVATISVGAEVGSYIVKAVSDNTDFWTVHGRPYG